MLRKDIHKEIVYILWLQNRIRQLRNAIRNETEFDSSTDTDLHKRKLEQYENDYLEAIDGLYTALLQF